jgi:hypothetical protein
MTRISTEYFDQINAIISSLELEELLLTLFCNSFCCLLLCFSLAQKVQIIVSGDLKLPPMNRERSGLSNSLVVIN